MPDSRVSAGHGGFSGFSIVNEGADWAVAIDDLSQGHYSAALSFLPFISASMVKGGRILIRQGDAFLDVTELAASRGGRRQLARILDKGSEAARYLKRIDGHHLLPKEFAEFFAGKGFPNLDAYVIPMDKAAHRLKPDGIHTGIEHWNAVWKTWIEGPGKAANKNRVLKQLRKMMKDFGLVG